MRYTVTTFKVRLEVADPGPPTRSSEDVWRFSQSIFKDLDADKEHFVLLVLNNKNRVNGFKVISTGTLTTCLVHPRAKCIAPSYVRNGGPRRLCFCTIIRPEIPAPSQEDQEITRRLKEIGDLFGIKVLDHVIVGHERFFSFADKGLL